MLQGHGGEVEVVQLEPGAYRVQGRDGGVMNLRKAKVADTAEVEAVEVEGLELAEPKPEKKAQRALLRVHGAELEKSKSDHVLKVVEGSELDVEQLLRHLKQSKSTGTESGGGGTAGSHHESAVEATPTPRKTIRYVVPSKSSGGDGIH